MAGVPLVRIHAVDEVRIDEVEKPRAGADDIVVRVAQCGICGSDLGYIGMGGLLGPGAPMPLGHELSGTVCEAGANVAGLRVGERIVVNPMGNDNRIGNSGPEGGFSPYLLVRGVAGDPACALKIPAAVDDELGALVEPLAVAMHGAGKAGLRPGDKAVIFGAGTIGLCLLLVLRHLGLRDIAVVDLSEQRLRAAEAMGGMPFNAAKGGLEGMPSGAAEGGLEGMPSDAAKGGLEGVPSGAAKGGLAEFLIERHGGAMLSGVPVPASDAYFEATGVGAVFTQAAQLAKTGARLVVLGVHKAPVEFDLVNLLMRELVVIGSMAYADEFSAVIAMLETGAINPKPLITHRYPLSQFPAALAAARDTEGAIKVLVDCQG